MGGCRRMDLGDLVEKSECRGCVVCGREFRSDKLGTINGRSALQKLAGHLIEHQPTMEQWTVAYEKIRAMMPKREKKGASGE